jgi:DNA polymerase-3 subunit alpha
LTYRTAYLKAHYPKEFLAASLTSEMGDTDRVVSLISESKRLGIDVLPPDVNRSFAEFRPVDAGIDFGLAAIKNVGKSAVHAIVREREENGKFDTIFGFCERVCGRQVNRRMLESLIASGAMDSIEGTRAQKTAALELAIKRADRIVSHRNAGQTSLFGESSDEAALELRLPEVEPWDRADALANEKRLLGFYVSGHPLAKYEKDINMLATITCDKIGQLKDDSNVVIAGVVSDVREKKSKRGGFTGFISLEDFSGSCELIAFSDVYARYEKLLREDSLVVVTGRVSTKEEGASKVLVDDVYSFGAAWSSFFDSLTISLPSGGLDNERMMKLQDLLSNSKGRCKVFMEIPTSDGKLVRVHLRKNPVSPSSELVRCLEEIVGGGSVVVRPKAGVRRN